MTIQKKILFRIALPYSSWFWHHCATLPLVVMAVQKSSESAQKHIPNECSLLSFMNTISLDN